MIKFTSRRKKSAVNPNCANCTNGTMPNGQSCPNCQTAPPVNNGSTPTTLPGQKPVQASFVTNRDEKGEPKTPEKVEVPRLAALKYHKKSENEVLVDEWTALLKNNGYEMKFVGSGWVKGNVSVRFFGLNFPGKKPSFTVYISFEPVVEGDTTEDLKEVIAKYENEGIKPVNASRKKADKPPAAQPQPPATPAPAPQTSKEPIPEGGTFDISTLSSEALSKAVKALASISEFEQDKSAQALIEAMTAELKTRPIENDEEKAPAQPAPAAPAPVMSSLFGGLKLASWFTTDGDELDVVEGGERVKEIGEAHSELDDNTGISRPTTVKSIKLASDMNISKAVKQSEKLGQDLRNLYLEAKSLTNVNDTRPVREAVESIFQAANLFNDATKTLNKQLMQEQQTEEAIKIKENNSKKKSSFGGLAIASEE